MFKLQTMKPSVVNPGSTWGEPGVNLHRPTLAPSAWTIAVRLSFCFSVASLGRSWILMHGRNAWGYGLADMGYRSPRHKMPFEARVDNACRRRGG
jgi:hypothetical protein